MSTQLPVKDPDAVLDYVIDWSLWLAVGEKITGTPDVSATAGVILPVGHSVTVDAAGQKVTFWLSGGTPESFSLVSCKITTDAGRTDRRTFQMRIAPR